MKLMEPESLPFPRRDSLAEISGLVCERLRGFTAGMGGRGRGWEDAAHRSPGEGGLVAFGLCPPKTLLRLERNGSRKYSGAGGGGWRRTRLRALPSRAGGTKTGFGGAPMVFSCPWSITGAWDRLAKSPFCLISALPGDPGDAQGPLGPLSSGTRAPGGAGCAWQPHHCLCQHLIHPSPMVGPFPGAWSHGFPSLESLIPSHRLGRDNLPPSAEARGAAARAAFKSNTKKLAVISVQ